MPTFQDYITAVKANVREPIVKVELLTSDEKVIDVWDVDIISGGLSLNNGNGSRRSCNMLLQNTTGSYTPIPEQQLWINTKIRVYTGLVVSGEDYPISRGIFVIGNPEVNSLMEEQTANLSFYDKWSLLDGTLGGELESEYVIPVGTNVGTAVRAIFAAAGDPKVPIIETTAITTPFTLYQEAGGTYSDLLISLAQMLSWGCYYDRNGFGRFQSPPDLNKAGVSWAFSASEVNYLGSQRKLQYDKVRNSIIVYGDNVDFSLIKATAEDTNLTSPTRVALIGRKTKVITDNIIHTQDLANQRAEVILVES